MILIGNLVPSKEIYASVKWFWKLKSTSPITRNTRLFHSLDHIKDSFEVYFAIKQKVWARLRNVYISILPANG